MYAADQRQRPKPVPMRCAVIARPSTDVPMISLSGASVGAAVSVAVGVGGSVEVMVGASDEVRSQRWRAQERHWRSSRIIVSLKGSRLAGGASQD